MITDVPLEIRQATPADYPALARLLAENFQGKFAIALGRNPARRARRMEVLLPFGVLCQGHVYVAWLGDTLAGSFTLKTGETIPAAEDFRRARRALQEQAGDRWGRATWAVAVLRFLGGPKLGPEECYLDNLVTAHALQRQGIAVRMAVTIYDTASSLGKATIWGDVMSSNQRVIGLYKKEGWEIVRRNYWVAPITWPLLGTPGIYRIRKRL